LMNIHPQYNFYTHDSYNRSYYNNHSEKLRLTYNDCNMPYVSYWFRDEKYPKKFFFRKGA
jgi:hypothetical protein